MTLAEQLKLLAGNDAGRNSCMEDDVIDEEYLRLLGVRDGLIHAAVTVGNLRESILGPRGCYLPPKRHTRLRAAADRRVADLNAVLAILSRDLSDARKALAARDKEPQS